MSVFLVQLLLRPLLQVEQFSPQTTQTNHQFHPFPLQLNCLLYTPPPAEGISLSLYLSFSHSPAILIIAKLRVEICLRHNLARVPSIKRLATNETLGLKAVQEDPRQRPAQHTARGGSVPVKDLVGGRSKRREIYDKFLSGLREKWWL